MLTNHEREIVARILGDEADKLHRAGDFAAERYADAPNVAAGLRRNADEIWEIRRKIKRQED